MHPFSFPFNSLLFSASGQCVHKQSDPVVHLCSGGSSQLQFLWQLSFGISPVARPGGCLVCHCSMQSDKIINIWDFAKAGGFSTPESIKLRLIMPLKSLQCQWCVWTWAEIFVKLTLCTYPPHLTLILVLLGQGLHWKSFEGFCQKVLWWELL